MARTVELNVNVDVNSKSVTDLKEELKVLEAEFENVGVGTARFNELGNSIKGIKSQLKDVELQFEGLDKEQRATALVDTFNGLTGAVGAAGSAFIAFGAESKAIEDAEKKLLGVIGVVNGLRDVSNSLVSANKLLGGSFKAAFTTATGAINVTRVALAGLGIGAIIFAVTELADAFDLFGTKAAEANERAARSLSAFETATKNAISAVKDKGDIAVAQAELEGKSEKELLDIKKQSVNDQLAALNALAKKQTDDFFRRQKEANGDKEELRKINEEFSKQAQANAATQSALNKELALLDINFKKDQKARNQKAKEDKDALLKEETQAEKEAAKEREAVRKQSLDQVVNAEISAAQAARERRLALATTEDEAIQIEYENKLAALKEAQIQEEIAVAGNQEALALIRQKYADLQVVATQDVINKEEELQAKRVADQKKTDEELAKSAEDSAKKIVDAENAKIAARNEFLRASQGAIQALGGLFKEGSDAAKAAALVDIAVGTGIGFINALDIAQKSAKAAGPGAAFAFPIFYASQIAAVLGAAGRAKAILQGGSGGAATAPPVPSAVPGGFANQPAPLLGSFTPGGAPVTGGTGGVTGGGGIQEGGAQTGGGLVPVVKAYVLSGDVTDAQEAELKINQKRKF